MSSSAFPLVDRKDAINGLEYLLDLINGDGTKKPATPQALVQGFIFLESLETMVFNKMLDKIKNTVEGDLISAITNGQVSMEDAELLRRRYPQYKSLKATITQQVAKRPAEYVAAIDRIEKHSNKRRSDAKDDKDHTAQEQADHAPASSSSSSSSSVSTRAAKRRKAAVNSRATKPPTSASASTSASDATNHGNFNFRLPDRKQITLQIDSDDTVEIIKRKIEKQTGIPADQQRLVSASRQLEDAQTLQDYHIQPASVVDVMLRCRGS
jgi:hypothetical protein